MIEDTLPKILIVDDKPENVYVMEKLLKKVEAQVFSTTSSINALELAADHDFCLAIVDVQMPEMDGYELVSLLRGNRGTSRMPVIFVSAIYSDEYHHRRGYDAGAVDFLSKPFIPEILLSKVHVFLDLYNQRHALQATIVELDKAKNKSEAMYQRILQFNEELEQTVAARTAELQAAYRTLALLDRNKADFIAVVAHELRTPLSLVKGYSEMLAQDEAIIANDIRWAQIEGIVSGSVRMHAIVNTMLDMARIDNQTMELLHAEIHPKALLQEVLAQLSKDAEDRNITLTSELTEDLPTFAADPDEMSRVFYHLLINAIKYTPDGGLVTITCAPIDEYGIEKLKIVVKDTGIGIDPEFQELVFTKFFQTGEVNLHSSGKTKFKGGGPGLGLAIAKGIVEAHNGRIWVESAGHDETKYPGSQIHVVLPLKFG